MTHLHNSCTLSQKKFKCSSKIMFTSCKHHAHVYLKFVKKVDDVTFILFYDVIIIFMTLEISKFKLP